MATTQTTLTPLGRSFPFIGIGVAAAQLITYIPSAEFIFAIDNGSIIVAAAGEDQQLIIQCELPRSFCYVLVESMIRIQGTTVDDWDLGTVCNLTDSAASAEKVSMAVKYDNETLGRDSTTMFTRTYRAKAPSKVIVPRANDDARLTLKLFNAVVDGTVSTLKFYARFLRYDRIQSQYWQVNTPVLTR